MTPRSTFGDAIAQRELRSPDGRSVLVVLGSPRGRGSRWRCPFQMRGLFSDRVFWGPGADSMQAIYTALEGIRVKLRDSGLSLSVPDTDPPYLGFPMFIPDILGPDVYDMLVNLVERRVERLVAQWEAAYNARYGKKKPLPSARREGAKGPGKPVKKLRRRPGPPTPRPD